ncbi:hypothetical protein [Streptomyces sp. NPDC088246]|uniref:hypothetical protein n=1 Tax=Streptomyces sp. NPDC088246 TaxID=3365842 RepID=UPI003815FED5
MWSIESKHASMSAGLPFLHRFVGLALAFHHAVRNDGQDLAATISRLSELTATGDFICFTDIAHFMAALPLPESSATRWAKDEDDVRSAWRGLVQARQEPGTGPGESQPASGR